ncbi:hypothetical protein RFI_13144 [Reticulomyxa filosa]|uniref:Uncharacterized protein n=1 Tax=Reticulomyxa filosa TaxID=46433 RepID=X6NCI1_RETFI|nr:hypothetical protein RFI_13144 [Reticulomyxa filosa]|eukprot:ETO24015.1 hypothetical protein RFI_13144 [Reticulomyxa filosa]
METKNEGVVKKKKRYKIKEEAEATEDEYFERELLDFLEAIETVKTKLNKKEPIGDEPTDTIIPIITRFEKTNCEMPEDQYTRVYAGLKILSDFVMPQPQLFARWTSLPQMFKAAKEYKAKYPVPKKGLFFFFFCEKRGYDRVIKICQRIYRISYKYYHHCHNNHYQCYQSLVILFYFFPKKKFFFAQVQFHSFFEQKPFAKVELFLLRKMHTLSHAHRHRHTYTHTRTHEKNMAMAKPFSVVVNTTFTVSSAYIQSCKNENDEDEDEDGDEDISHPPKYLFNNAHFFFSFFFFF